MRIAVLIDGNAAFAMSRGFDFDIDYDKLLQFLEEEYSGQVVLRKFYIGVPEEPSEGQLKFWHSLEKVGYEIIKEPLKREFGSNGPKYKRPDMSFSIGFDIADIKTEFDLLVIIGVSHGCERSLRTLAQRGKKIVVIASFDSVPKKLRYLESPEVRNFEFLELEDIQHEISKDKRRYAQ